MDAEDKVELQVTHKSMVRSEDQLICLNCTSNVWPEAQGQAVDLACQCDRVPATGTFPREWMTVEEAQGLARVDG